MSVGETISDNSSIINQMQSVQNGEILPVTRDSAGRFIPGVSGNPAGRMPTVALTDYLRNKLENTGYSAKIGDSIVEAAAGEKQLKPGQLDAAGMLMDRVYGKAQQNMNVKGLIVMMPADAALDAAFNGSEE